MNIIVTIDEGFPDWDSRNEFQGCVVMIVYR